MSLLKSSIARPKSLSEKSNRTAKSTLAIVSPILIMADELLTKVVDSAIQEEDLNGILYDLVYNQENYEEAMDICEDYLDSEVDEKFYINDKLMEEGEYSTEINEYCKDISIM